MGIPEFLLIALAVLVTGFGLYWIVRIANRHAIRDIIDEYTDTDK